MPKQSSMFAETSEGLAIVHNTSALNTCKFKTVGKILAAMIFLGGSPPQCFVPAIADFIVYDEVRSVPDIGCVQDYSVRSALIKVNSSGIVSLVLGCRDAGQYMLHVALGPVMCVSVYDVGVSKLC